jgi:putative aminopeptidase FrvX
MAMNDDSLEFLKRLLDAPGPSGFETHPASIWREQAEKFADVVDRDSVGSSYAILRKEGAPVVSLVGHIDEIGVQITHIDEQGFLWFDKVGGWDDIVFVGQRMRIITDNGWVIGVIGRKAAHLLKKDDGDKSVKVQDLWIDIGAKDAADAKARVQVGDAAVIDANFIQVTDDIVTSRSLDNRVGAWVALETVQLLADDRPAVEVVAVASAQEEISFAGAYAAGVRLASAVAIAIDVTHCSDYPGGNKAINGDVRLGGGPVLHRGSSQNPIVYRELVAASKRLGLELPVQAQPSSTGTDADALIYAGVGTAAGVVSIPNRYMHSPNELVSLSDLENAAKLLAEFIRGITPESDFRP